MTTLEINSREPQAGRLSLFPIRLLAKSLGGEKKRKEHHCFLPANTQRFQLIYCSHNNQGKYHYCPVVQTGEPADKRLVNGLQG